MSRLAEALDVSVASATGIVDRMEQRGLVERRRSAGRPARRRWSTSTDAGARGLRAICAERRRARLDADPRAPDRRRARGFLDRPAGDAPRPRAPRWPPRPRAARARRRMIGLLPDLPAAVRAAARRRPRPAARPGDRQPVPARPQRRHHQQRRRQGRHRLHPPDRRADARRHARSLGVAVDRRASTSARAIAMGFGRDVRERDLRARSRPSRRSRSTSSARRR